MFCASKVKCADDPRYDPQQSMVRRALSDSDLLPNDRSVLKIRLWERLRSHGTVEVAAESAGVPSSDSGISSTMTGVPTGGIFSFQPS